MSMPIKRPPKPSCKNAMADVRSLLTINNLWTSYLNRYAMERLLRPHLSTEIDLSNAIRSTIMRMKK